MSRYVGWELDHQDRDMLMTLVHPAYPDVIAHHVTLSLDVANTPLPTETSCDVVGFVDDGAGVQALVVKIGGTTKRPDGGTFHITWSIDRERGRKPFHSNRAINEHKVVPFSVTFPMKLTPRVFG